MATARIVSAWQGGFQVEVTVTNTGTTPISGWLITWTKPVDQTIHQLWNGRMTVSGTSVSVEGVGWNTTIPPGASVSFGYTASGPAVAPQLTCRPR
ncbi:MULTISPECIES: cellulose binding domain-containing protein [Saccharothrix]|uniref:cellulose binding domain-containing protein n=1 Tax=Saccharothrix TaxID=2071 RepID=UPI001F51CC51|nr:cellulose binding domain-containing protein [Saccharothrix sp. CB00851]